MKKLLHDWLGWGYPVPSTGVWRPSHGMYQTNSYACRFCSDRITAHYSGHWRHLSSSQYYPPL